MRSSRARGSSIASTTSHLSSDANTLMYAASYITQISLMIFISYSMLSTDGQTTGLPIIVAGNKLGCPLHLVKTCPTRRSDNVAGVSKKRAEARAEQLRDSRPLFMAARNALGKK
jgi:hypothetical protein